MKAQSISELQLVHKNMARRVLLLLVLLGTDVSNAASGRYGEKYIQAIMTSLLAQDTNQILGPSLLLFLSYSISDVRVILDFEKEGGWSIFLHYEVTHTCILCFPYFEI